MFRSLMTSRRFAPLFWCQFFAAFNDNFLRNALIILILFKLGTAGGEVLVTLSGAIFMAPFFSFRPRRQFADRFDKAIIARRLKFTEIGAAGVAVVGFALQSVPILFAPSSFSERWLRFSRPSNTASFPTISTAPSCRQATR